MSTENTEQVLEAPANAESQEVETKSVSEIVENKEATGEVKTEDKPPEQESSVIREMRRALKRQGRELQELRQMQAIALQKEEPAPTRENYADDASYLRAEIAHQVKQQIQPQTKPPDILEQTREAARKNHADFDEALQDIDHIHFRQKSVEVFADAIETLEHGDELYYRLVKNPELTERLAALPPNAFAVKLGEIHSDIMREKKEKKPVSKAPAPISPVTSSVPPAKDYDSLTPEEFAKRRYDERKKHRLGLYAKT
jgi:predicted RNase H-related nuclease YkuK (DUF458 family)